MKKLILIIVCMLVALPAIAHNEGNNKTKIGVIYMLHGGMDENTPQGMWEASVHQFSYEVSHPVYQLAIWNPSWWPAILQSEEAVKFLRKYEFEYERIGGIDPFHTLTDQQLADMKAELDKNTDNLEFEVEFASWMSAERPGNYPYPRFLYNGPSEGANVNSKLTYCGEDEADGPWVGCDPERFNIDGPVERLLDKGVSRIIAIDMAVGGVRFYKPFDVLRMTKRAMQDYNNGEGTTVPILWVNDYGNVMERSYPTAPTDWGAYSPYPPDPATFVDPKVLLNGCPNPVAEDLDYALLHVEGIEAGMSGSVGDSETGVLLFNHGLFRAARRFFDPKIDDTLVLDKNIKALMLERHPEMDPDNIIGAYGGVREVNPENGIYERTRPMRGEDLAHSYLHETEQDMPGDEWGYRYWDALEYLKDRGVKHIVVSFPQVVTDSVLTLVEYYNQIGKEIGTKTWLYYDEGDFDTYPGVGHPFADYWGNWVDTDCDGEECCFEMGGCNDGRDYPPPRQQPIDESRTDMDPSLAYDLSDYGHLGYDPDIGPPDPNAPVQNQYTGTWVMYVTPSDDPKMGQLLAKHVLNAVVNPMVHITNGEIASITEGQSITWQANVQSGTPGYTYEWFIKKDGDEDWTSAGDNSASWTWTPAAGDAGTYDVRCVVTDAEAKSGEVTFGGFVVIDSLQIDKCKVKAGIQGKGDKIKFSGWLDATEDDFFEADSVNVTISVDDVPILEQAFEINEDSFKKGKYKSPKIKPIEKGDPVTKLQIDTTKGKIKFSGKNLDLTGLSCPITVMIQIGSYVAVVEQLGEEIVNGT